MVKKMGSICSEDEESKNIPNCELFYRVALDITRPLPQIESRNK
jgi:hypothetical protein